MTQFKDALIDIPEKTFTIFRQVITYGYESAYLTPENTFDVNLRDVFFSELYVERPSFEKRITSYVTSQGLDLGVVVGVQGSGKSTILRRVAREVDSNKYPFLSIDFRSFYTESLEESPTTAWPALIKNALKASITERY